MHPKRLLKSSLLDHRTSGFRGFTVMELLLVLSVITVLMGIIIPVAGSVSQKAREVTERNGARQAITAWTAYSFDNNGRIMPGYKADLEYFTPQGLKVTPELTEDGWPVAGRRYPLRLAPYLGNNFDVIYVNEQRAVLNQLRDQSPEDYLYAVSVSPSLGLNSTWVGGDEGDGCFNPTLVNLLGRIHSDRISTVRNPSKLIVFASSRSGASIYSEGYFRVASPAFSSRRWQDHYDEDDAASFGNVSGRWGGSSIVATVDGAVESLTLEEIDDMRRWSDRANASDWVLAP
jgi:type II secretory pathway pseudopilin PulG